MATYILVKLNRLPTRVFVVLPNSGHVTNEGALAEFVYRKESANKRYRNTVNNPLSPNTVSQIDEKPAHRKAT